MAYLSIVLGSTFGLFSGLISFAVFDFSFFASFGVYQATGVAVAFLIIILNTFVGPSSSSARPSVHAVNS